MTAPPESSNTMPGLPWSRSGDASRWSGGFRWRLRLTPPCSGAAPPRRVSTDELDAIEVFGTQPLPSAVRPRSRVAAATYPSTLPAVESHRLHEVGEFPTVPATTGVWTVRLPIVRLVERGGTLELAMSSVGPRAEGVVAIMRGYGRVAHHRKGVKSALLVENAPLRATPSLVLGGLCATTSRRWINARTPPSL